MLNDTFARRSAPTADALLRRREVDRLRAFSDRIAALARARKESARRRLLASWRS